MSFDTIDSLKAYLDATMAQTKDGKIIVTCEDAEQIIDYLPTYFEDKQVEYCDSYGTMIPVMTTGLPQRVTGYLASGRLEVEQLFE